MKKTKSTISYKIIATIILLFSINLSFAQEITFDVSSFTGYQISCHGASTGSIDATIVGGTAPYTYSWSNGATTEDLSNLPAGSYTLIVTDANSNSSSKSITLEEPDVLSASLKPSDFNGFAISVNGGSNGKLDCNVSGGATPYIYAWNTSSTESSIGALSAGTYSVTVTDQNGCSVNKNETLTEPQALVISSLTVSHTVSCFRGSNGALSLTASGGVSPYKYNWSNGSFVQNPTDLSAGDYTVEVNDRNGATVLGQITINQPTELKVQLTPSYYTGGNNISCENCNNGTLTSIITGGTSSFSYLWSAMPANNTANGQTTANLSSLDVGDYYLSVTDANGCVTKANAKLTQPGHIGWDKPGNSVGTTDFIGTTNNAPLVFKTNNTEKIRIAENGNVGIGTTNPTEKMDVNGNINVAGSIKFGEGGQINFIPSSGGSPSYLTVGPLLPGIDPAFPPSFDPCFTPSPLITAFPVSGLHAYQNASGQVQLFTGWNNTRTIIESMENPLYINTDCGGDIYMCSGLNSGGNVGIGTNAPTAKLDVVGNVNVSGGENIAGNVGIGITTPTAKLEVHNSSTNYADKTFVLTRGSGNSLLIEPKLDIYDYNGLTKTGDAGIFFSDGAGTNGIDNLNGGFVIGPLWGPGGIRINKNGQVGIGTALSDNSPPNYKLAVNGTIGAKELKIEINSNAWWDVVFDKNYKLMSLKELESYLNKNKHLPNVPSVIDVDKDGGIMIGDMQAKLLQKVEELTLYIIEQNKRIEELEKNNKK